MGHEEAPSAGRWGRSRLGQPEQVLGVLLVSETGVRVRLGV